jgi:hypothetical protein
MQILRSRCKLLHGFEVEWCRDLPGDGAGGCLPDEATYVRRAFGTLPEATTYAKKVLSKDCFGSVRVTEFEMVPLSDDIDWVLTREYVSDSTFIDTL